MAPPRSSSRRARPRPPWMPAACPHCSGGPLYVEGGDGIACLMCGWRPTRRPEAEERELAARRSLPRGVEP